MSALVRAFGVTSHHYPKTKHARSSELIHRRKPAAAGAEVGRLSLINAGSQQQCFPGISVKPNVILQCYRLLVDSYSAHRRRDQGLSNIIPFQDCRPDAFRQLVTTISSTAAKTRGGFKEVSSPRRPKLISDVFGNAPRIGDRRKHLSVCVIRAKRFKRIWIAKPNQVSFVGIERVVARRRTDNHRLVECPVQSDEHEQSC